MDFVSLNHVHFIKKVGLVLAILSSLSVAEMVSAAGATGTLFLELDQDALMKLQGGSSELGHRFWWVEDIFDETFNNVEIGPAQPNPTPGYEALSGPIVIPLKVNGPTIQSAPAEASRQLQPTTLNYTDDPTKGTGKIGLSGAWRSRSDSWKGYLLAKEMTLEFDPERVNKGGVSYDPSVITQGGHGESGWVIKTNEVYFGSQGLFDLVDVTTSTDANGALKLTGTLILAVEWGTLLAVDEGNRVGKATLVPDSAPVLCTVDCQGTPTVTSANATYDDVTMEANIKNVKVGNQNYYVQLKLSDDGKFTLKNYQAIKDTDVSDIAIYDEANASLSIPKIKTKTEAYKVSLKNTGNYQFKLETIETLK